MTALSGTTTLPADQPYSADLASPAVPVPGATARPSPAPARAPTREPWCADAIAWRIRQLIARHDGGDVSAAARRLGVPIRRVVRLERVLESRDSHAAQELLCDVVLRYQANAAWLLTGAEHVPGDGLPDDVRLWIARCLTRVANRVVDEARSRYAHGGTAGPATVSGTSSTSGARGGSGLTA